ncbi:MAG: transglycosylase [Chlorobi bacterium]|nr:transglycosylase [Chlorobiota bacterium]
MGLIINIVVGAVIGWLASIIARTNNQMGCLWNIVVGVLGAALGHWIAQRFFASVASSTGAFSIRSLLISIGGAVLLILILRTIGILKHD